MPVNIITGKGGVGKTTGAIHEALEKVLQGENVYYLSIDVLNSPSDSLGFEREFWEEPLNENSWQTIWKHEPWKTYKKELGKNIGNLLIKTSIPTGKYLHELKDVIEKGLYTEYEINAANEIIRFAKKDIINQALIEIQKGLSTYEEKREEILKETGRDLLAKAGKIRKQETLIIDTDSLEGINRLLNYFKEQKNKTSNNSRILDYEIRHNTEIIPVTTLEQPSMEKLNDYLIEKGININKLIINHTLNNDLRLEELQYYTMLSNAKQKILYEQNNEPLGLNILGMTRAKEIKKNAELHVTNESIPQARVYMTVGKGGQGKTTSACALAIALAKKGKKVLLMSADARSSLSHILNEKIEGDEVWTDLSKTEQYSGLNIKARKTSNYWDEVPGMPLMKSLMRILKEYNENKDTVMVIDGPPSGNMTKSIEKGIENPDFIQEWIYQLDCILLKRRSNHLLKKLENKMKLKINLETDEGLTKLDELIDTLKDGEVKDIAVKCRGLTGTYDFMTDRRETYTKGLEILSSKEFIVIPVMQPTNTALTETNNIISKLYTYDMHPYNIFNDTDRKYIIINRVKEIKNEEYEWSDNELEQYLKNTEKHYMCEQVLARQKILKNENLIKYMKEYEFPNEEYNMIIIPDMKKEPIGRKELEKIADTLMN